MQQLCFAVLQYFLNCLLNYSQVLITVLCNTSFSLIFFFANGELHVFTNWWHWGHQQNAMWNLSHGKLKDTWKTQHNEPDPGSWPTGRYVPTAVWWKVTHWVHTTRFTCHPGKNRTTLFLQSLFSLWISPLGVHSWWGWSRLTTHDVFVASLGYQPPLLL